MLLFEEFAVAQEIQEGFGRLLLLVSTVAFCAMAVASLGVTNTIMASIRSRRWQFGILRSIGVTRSGLLRLVLAEAILLGLVGCALGLAAGLLMFADAHELGRLVLGYKPPADIPWLFVAAGAGIVLLISLLASLSTRMHRVRLWHGRAADNALDVTREEHRRIYEAIMQGDPELARAAATAHIASGERWLRRQVETGASA